MVSQLDLSGNQVHSTLSRVISSWFVFRKYVGHYQTSNHFELAVLLAALVWKTKGWFIMECQQSIVTKSLQ